MKSLKDTVLEAISSGKQYRQRLQQFPTTPEKEDIFDWLEYNGFRLISHHSDITPTAIRRKSKSSTDRIYFKGPYDGLPMHQWVYFGTRDIMFFIRTEPKYPDMWYDDFIKEPVKRIFINDFAEFRDKVNDYFGS